MADTAKTLPLKFCAITMALGFFLPGVSDRAKSLTFIALSLATMR